jgi:hypothetical protein
MSGKQLRRALIRLAHEKPELRPDLLPLLKQARALSKVKKKPAPHMWFLSRDSAGGFLVTIGDPRNPGSKIKERFSDAADLKDWVRYEVGNKVSPDHVYDATKLKLVPNFYTEWFVENMM